MKGGPLRSYLPAPLVFIVGLAAGLGLQRLAPLGWLTGGSRWIVGLALVVVSLPLGFWSIAAMRRLRTSPVPYTAANALVTGGPYRFSRHPMYVSMIVTYAGLAALMGAPWSLILIPVVMVVLWRWTMLPEERYLAERFPDYAAYRDRVRPWL